MSLKSLLLAGNGANSYTKDEKLPMFILEGNVNANYKLKKCETILNFFTYTFSTTYTSSTKEEVRSVKLIVVICLNISTVLDFFVGYYPLCSEALKCFSIYMKKVGKVDAASTNPAVT